MTGWTRRGAVLAVAGLLSACGSTGRAAVTPVVPAAGSLPPTVSTIAQPSTAPPSTAPPTAVPTTSTPTVPTTTSPPANPQLLAGAMVLCSFSGATVPDWALDRLRAGLAAGLLLYQRNLSSEAQGT